MANMPDQHINLNQIPQITATQPRSGSSTANTSPIDAASSAARSPLGNPPGLGGSASNMRLGTGSPLHELGGRLYSKRAREIQAQEGLSLPTAWGPPASGGSTPLRETIPESPSQDGFPDFVPPGDSPTSAQASARRPRAGTVPSRFSPGNGPTGASTPGSAQSRTSRPTPSTSPFRPHSAFGQDNGIDFSGNSSTSALLSRLRAGSMPQKTNLGQSGPFGNTFFSSGWGTGRERGNTLSSIRSSDAPDSPAQSSFYREGFGDAEVKTLDYLGLAENPQQGRTNLATGANQLSSSAMLHPLLSNMQDINRNNINRYRSYSVNAKEKYAEDEEDEYGSGRYSGLGSGTMTPSAASAAAALAATQAQIHQHNLAVQAFANQASASRPRARTAGVLDAPLRGTGRSFFGTPSRLENSMLAADFMGSDSSQLDALPDTLRSLRLASFGPSHGDAPEDHGLEGPTRALWLGNIPTSTTVSSLQAIFQAFGSIESTRVLVQKNCGFVNFETVESAIAAKSLLNGKEIFPGAGPVRIGFAKAPSSGNGTPGGHGTFPSPSPDPFKSQEKDERIGVKSGEAAASGVHQRSAAAALEVPELSELRDEMLSMVRDFGANDQDVATIVASLDIAIGFTDFQPDIPAISEPSHARIHDAPKLREIRKRIDNNAMTQEEIEEVALGMLSEIAELASDYLGNTVVQKLFEYCAEPTKEAMLQPIAPHLAEIGVHKNGTWAAQKIIDVVHTPAQFSMIVENLRPYAPLLFLDQYGNYVLQCCLRFGAPWNNFIFESMLGRLWDISQGRFGARAMRACLESHHSTKDQQRLLASAIALHSVQLATNANSALLLTWLLDTCNLPRRRTVLAPRIVPHLVHLCTHKVAYLTVLKIINQRNEPEAREIIIQALFFSPEQKTLEDILSDQACGATLIHKILTTPFWEESSRNEVVQNVRNVLVRLKVTPAQGYKRLMDEVGLSSRSSAKPDREANGNSPYNDRSRSGSQQRGHAAMERQGSGPYPNSAAAMYGTSPTIGAGMGFDQFGGSGQMFNPATLNVQQLNAQQLNVQQLNAQQLNAQQLQYQQALLNSGVSPRSLAGPGTVFGGFDGGAEFDGFGNGMRAPMSQQGFPVLQNGGYSGPMMPQGMNPGMMGAYGGAGQAPFFPQQMGQQQGGRRGRR